MFSKPLLWLVLCGGLLIGGGCKRSTPGQFGSADYEDSGNTSVPSGQGAIRAILGQLDFETSSPLPGSGGALGVPSVAVGTGGDSGTATVRMQFSVSFDRPASSLEEISQRGGEYVRVGTLTTFDINHEPVTSRLVTEQVGRPVYLVPVSACPSSCLRLVTGGGAVKERSQIIILELAGQSGNWSLKWFSYFGKEVKEYGMPVELVRQDAFDGPL